MSRFRRLRDLSLFWKVLLPFLGLVVVMGALGTLLVVKDLSSRAQATLDRELSRRSLDARTSLHDRELYLLEAVNFASNVQGMAEAIKTADGRATRTLLESVLALKTELDLLTVIDQKGRSVIEFKRGAAGMQRVEAGRDWNAEAFVGDALREPSGGRSSALVRFGETTMLAIAGPVCSRARDCGATGVAIAGLSMQDLAAAALARSASQQASAVPGTGVTIFGTDGQLLAVAGAVAPALATPLGGRHARRTGAVGSTEVESLYAPLEIGGTTAGTVAVTVPRVPAFASVRGAAIRLALIVLGAMALVVAVGALLSRFMLSQVRPLVNANRALGRGELSARVPVRSEDELGELARGVDHMAEQLQASYETLESRVVERTEEVERLLQQRSDFFAAMSHEFRTPLAVILSEADMLADPRQRPALRTIREAGEALRASGAQLLSSINEILALAEADAGGVEIELEEVRLSDVLGELRPFIEGLAKGNGLKIDVGTPTDVSPVMADRSHLRDVILNLVDNSVKYTPSGGTVGIHAAQNNGLVEVSVEDTGIGIPADVGERIFDPFFRVKGTKPLRGQASSGLGLALAKHFVEAQGGQIRYADRPEGGTIFTFSLVPAVRG